MKEQHLEQEQQHRRGFIMGALYAIPLLIGSALTAPVGSYLFGGQKATEKNSWADAGDISDVPSGTPCQVRFERAVVDGWKVRNQESSAWVILDEERRVTAFSPLCTHLGCAYSWQAERKLFACPCHGSTFNIQGGVITGPASRPLDRLSAKLESNRLWLGPVQDSQGA